VNAGLAPLLQLDVGTEGPLGGAVAGAAVAAWIAFEVGRAFARGEAD